MSTKSGRRKCLCCKHVFTADYRNGHHQRYCSQPACQQTSKKASQRRWRRKPENRTLDYGEYRVGQVQAWRQRHPGYWKPFPGSQPTDLQPVNPEQISRNVPAPVLSPLRDVCWEQNPAFVGLISLVTGSTLREDIAATTRQLLLKGQNILGLQTPGPTPESVK
jgi:hypothetical protein